MAKIVARRYTWPPGTQEQRSIRYVNWMREQRALIARRLLCQDAGKISPASDADAAKHLNAPPAGTVPHARDI